MEWLAYRLADLSDRERMLLLALVAVALPVAVGLLGILPLLEARVSARAAVAEAEALRGWVAARVADLPPDGLAAPPPDVPEAPPIGLSGLEQSLQDAGLRDRVAQLSNRSGGGVDLEFDAVEFDALTEWLYRTTFDWGYRIAAFRIERDSPGLASAGFTLEPL